MQFSRTVFVAVDGIVESFRPVPPVALIPFFVLLFGFSELGKIAIVTLGTSLVMIVSIVEAIERVGVGVVRWGFVRGLSRAELFRRIVIPAAWPELRAGLRVAMALAFTLTVVAEFMGANFGLGYLISVSRVTLTTPTIFLSVLILGLSGWLFDRALRHVFAISTKWDIRATGALR
jgi:ABC-type nitrate/sulfonate/bicarbonate transport system permease component